MSRSTNSDAAHAPEVDDSSAPAELDDKSEVKTLSALADGEDVSADVDKLDDAVGSADSEADAAEPVGSLHRRPAWGRVVGFGVLPVLILLLTVVAGYVKYQEARLRNDETARIESMQAAKDTTVAMLSYQPETAEQQLGAVRDSLTGAFRDSYTQLTNDVVIPGAKQKRIAAVASVPAAASVSADGRNAVVLVFVNQSTTIGTGAPSDTASSVRVGLEKVDGRWLVSQFDPI